MSMFMCPAVHTMTHSLLRSSSTHEPSDPPLRVIIYFCFVYSQNCFYWKKSKIHQNELAYINFFNKLCFYTYNLCCECLSSNNQLTSKYPKTSRATRRRTLTYIKYKYNCNCMFWFQRMYSINEDQNSTLGFRIAGRLWTMYDFIFT